MWVKRVNERDKTLVNRAVIQTTAKGTYMSVQDKHGVILGTAKWSGRFNSNQANDLLTEDQLWPDRAWRQPRPGVWVTYVRDVKG